MGAIRFLAPASWGPVRETPILFWVVNLTSPYVHVANPLHPASWHVGQQSDHFVMISMRREFREKYFPDTKECVLLASMYKRPRSQRESTFSGRAREITEKDPLGYWKTLFTLYLDAWACSYWENAPHTLAEYIEQMLCFNKVHNLKEKKEE